MRFSRRSIGIEDRLNQWLAEVAAGKTFISSQIFQGDARPTINKALVKKTKAGELMRVARGIYVKPRISALVGPVPPGAESIALAIVAAEGAKLFAIGAAWANFFDLTTQLTCTPTYLTSGRPHRIQLGRKGRLVLLRGSTREIRLARFPAGRAILALEWAGRSEDPVVDIGKIQGHMAPDDFQRFLCEGEAPGGWIAQATHGFSSPG